MNDRYFFRSNDMQTLLFDTNIDILLYFMSFISLAFLTVLMSQLRVTSD